MKEVEVRLMRFFAMDSFQNAQLMRELEICRRERDDREREFERESGELKNEVRLV